MHNNILFIKVLFDVVSIVCASSGSCSHYVVRPGDTCYTLGIVKALNPHINCKYLRAGQRLCLFMVPGCGHPHMLLYTVNYGDTCYTLGIRQQLYPSINCNNLKPGQQVCVLKSSIVANNQIMNTLPACQYNRYYKINHGDTCYSISKFFYFI